jgi:hypothetical protein
MRIEVKFRVDDVNVDRDDCKSKLPYGVETYPNLFDEGYSVLVDVTTDDMVKVLQGNGFEVIKKVRKKYNKEVIV